jgi:predicted alpha/beta-fold hydrolase
VRLQGIIFRAAKPRASALLLVHGYAGNFYEAYFPKLAEAAAHTGYDTLTDACMAWPMLNKGGIMLFDDYLWRDMPGVLHRPKLGIDLFLMLFDELA